MLIVSKGVIESFRCRACLALRVLKNTIFEEHCCVSASNVSMDKENIKLIGSIELLLWKVEADSAYSEGKSWN